MSSEASKDDVEELAHRALDAHIFKVRGISPNSRWAKNYSKMMREPLDPEEVRAFQEKLKNDPAFAEQWMDKVLSGFHHLRSRPSKRPSRKSKVR